MQVLGIVSLVMFFAVCGLGFIPAVIALALAPGARREIAASGGALGGASQLRAGTIMAWITLGLTALGLVIADRGHRAWPVSTSDELDDLRVAGAGERF